MRNVILNTIRLVTLKTGLKSVNFTKIVLKIIAFSGEIKVFSSQMKHFSNQMKPFLSQITLFSNKIKPFSMGY